MARLELKSTSGHLPDCNLGSSPQIFAVLPDKPAGVAGNCAVRRLSSSLNLG